MTIIRNAVQYWRHESFWEKMADFFITVIFGCAFLVALKVLLHDIPVLQTFVDAAGYFVDPATQLKVRRAVQILILVCTVGFWLLFHLLLIFYKEQRRLDNQKKILSRKMSDYA
ncbi:MAG: hypothetical protein LHV69_00800 [Elusimicrobia bacterium]|nr:hypothetical protein [Candidatus Obscuribacterium magneticum]